MLAILIDPTPLVSAVEGGLNGPVSPVKVVGHNGDPEDIYRKLSYPGRDVKRFECVRNTEFTDCIYVDVDQRIHAKQLWFAFPSFELPMSGRGLICGIDDAGDNAQPEATLDVILDGVIIGYRQYEWTNRAGLVTLSKPVLHHWRDTHEWLDIDHLC